MHVQPKAGKTVNNRLPFGNGSVHIHKIRKRFLYFTESVAYLHQPAQRNLVRQIARHCHNHRENNGYLRITGINPDKLFAFLNNFPEVVQKQCKTLFKNAALTPFAAVKSNALGVFAHAHHAETEICFVTLLNKIKPNQLFSGNMRYPCAKRRINKRHPHHIAFDMEAVPPKRKIERPGNIIQNKYERYKSAYRL